MKLCNLLIFDYKSILKTEKEYYLFASRTFDQIL